MKLVEYLLFYIGVCDEDLVVFFFRLFFFFKKMNYHPDEEGKQISDEEDVTKWKSNDSSPAPKMHKSKTKHTDWESDDDFTDEEENSENPTKPTADYLAHGNYVPSDIVEEKFVDMYTDGTKSRIVQRWRTTMRFRRYNSVLRLDLLKENSVKLWHKCSEQAKKIDRRMLRRKISEIKNKFKGKNHYAFDHHSD